MKKGHIFYLFKDHSPTVIKLSEKKHPFIYSYIWNGMNEIIEEVKSKKDAHGKLSLNNIPVRKLPPEAWDCILQEFPVKEKVTISYQTSFNCFLILKPE